MTTCKTCPWCYHLGGSYYCVQGVLEGACRTLAPAEDMFGSKRCKHRRGLIDTPPLGLGDIPASTPTIYGAKRVANKRKGGR